MSSALSQYQKNLVKALNRVARLRLLWPVLLAMFLLYANLPLINEQSAIEKAQSSTAYDVAVEAMKKRLKDAGPPAKEQRIFLYDITPFVQVAISYAARWDSDVSPPVLLSGIDAPPSVSLRTDQVALGCAMIIMLGLAFSTLHPRSEVAATVLQEQRSATLSQEHTTARQVFAQEVKLAEYRAETLFKRSTFLLTGGVLMAFVGVAIFYATLPEPPHGQAQIHSTYWVSGIRAAGMLVFLEAIAWFLLRQYRNLIEDFKVFHRIYMKRANYLAAITVLDKETVRAEDLLLVTALLGEDFSGKLHSGETTEALESMKNESANPVFHLVHDALAKAFARSSTEKGDKDGTDQ